ncbi:protease, membrane anchored [Escherichia coli]|uniref:Protease, membrane anchored n=1 Tax=Escherichia coli TaxID=562 RepID=A0A376TKR6_ECOLX|nr:protease, membrane anchored [Escherichia coli]
MLIFIPILIFVALVIVGAGVKIVPQGYQWTVERFWSLYQNVTAGAQSGGAVYGSHWSQDQYDGASARYPFPGSYLER